MKQLNFRPRMVLFLGDGVRDLAPLLGDGMDYYAVAGNCDGSTVFPVDEPLVRTVVAEGCRIVMMHGHTFGVKYGERDAIRYAVEQNADVLLYGHTHRPCVHTVCAEETGNGKPLIVANPGSLGEPRDGGRASFGVLTVRNGIYMFSHGELL